MHELRVGFQPDLFARLELMTFAEHRDHLFASQIGENLCLLAGRLDDDDLGFGAVVGQADGR